MKFAEENKRSFEVLHPLIQETAHKITGTFAKEAQTGPALRNDTKTIEKHFRFLRKSQYKNLYQLLTQSITTCQKSYKNS